MLKVSVFFIKGLMSMPKRNLQKQCSIYSDDTLAIVFQNLRYNLFSSSFKHTDRRASTLDENKLLKMIQLVTCYFGFKNNFQNNNILFFFY